MAQEVKSLLILKIYSLFEKINLNILHINCSYKFCKNKYSNNSFKSAGSCSIKTFHGGFNVGGGGGGVVQYSYLFLYLSL